MFWCAQLIGSFVADKMGRTRDQTNTETTKVKCLSEGCNNIEIAKMVRHDHCTVKEFLSEDRQGRKKFVKKQRCKLTEKFVKN